MIGRRCTHSNVFSRPVLIARDLLSSRICLPGQRHEGCIYLSQVKYCGGYSGDEPPLTIPNREVKLTSADGTAPPGGRVGRCRFSGARSKKFDRAPFVVLTPFVPESPRKRQRPTGPDHWGRDPPNPLCRSAPKPYAPGWADRPPVACSAIRRAAISGVRRGQRCCAATGRRLSDDCWTTPEETVKKEESAVQQPRRKAPPPARRQRAGPGGAVIPSGAATGTEPYPAGEGQSWSLML